MAKHDPGFTPPSLAQHFEAPEDFVGCFGWLCGFSADGGFLDDAVERFVRKTHAQRAYEGRVAMALMLDPGNVQITPKEVPSVLHLPIKSERPFKLLHAKVAVLGFRHTSDTQQWRLRLVVSTGNWTRETLHDSLDLAWRVDLSNQDLKVRDDGIAQMCADMTAAWRMLDWVRRYFDARVLYVTPGERPESDAGVATGQVEKWLKEVSNVGKRIAPRFFDNRDASLLSMLPAMVERHAASSARNYLAMGSGFYEASDDKEAIPSVLKKIVDTLRDAHLLTRRPIVDVFVNPKACQGVAKSVLAFHEAGWNVRDAGKPAYFRGTPRSLHAKFIFSASHRDNSDLCNGAWLYLGSGNLTGPGFANKMSAHGGNLEAGIITVPESLRWHPARNKPPETVVTNLLPLQWDDDFSESPETLVAGGDMPEPEIQYFAPPVAFLFWVGEGQSGWLRVSAEEAASFDVLDAAGQACQRDTVKGFVWLEARPREVQLRWHSDDKVWRAFVPVIDEFGRIAATALPRIDIDQAWGQLANFPMPPDDEELPDDGDDESRDSSFGEGMPGADTANYPVRQMMQLIENIASKQCSVRQADWAMWCARLEQCLIQAAESPVLEEFVKLQLNPLSPLWHSPFRPDFALTRETMEGCQFEESLKRVEMAWGTTSLSDIGERS